MYPVVSMETRPLDTTSPSEVADVLALVRLVYGRDMSEAFYRWRFLASPFGAPLVSLLWDGGTLAGHYAMSPTRSWCGALGGPVATAQSMTTMTHPDYRNRGVFTDLAADLYARAESRGVAMVWGMPNTQSHFGFREKLGWRDIGVMFTMARAVTATDAASVAPVLELLSGPPTEVGELFARSDDGRVFLAAREHAYFQWRYLDHPTVTYRFATLPGGAGDVLAVIKSYEVTADVRSLEVVDCLYGRSPARFGELMRALIAHASSTGHAFVRTWMGLADPAFGALEKLGFVPREPLAYAGGRELGTSRLPATTWSHAGCYVTMGDSDNY